MSDKEKAERIIKEITEAFKGVELGDGIGLLQAQAIDSYRTKEEQFRAREEDEKSNWTKISFEKLNKCNSSPCFFDGEGMRFHLPAFLIVDLRQEYRFDLIFTFFDFYNKKQPRFDLLNTEQRKAVRSYLQYYLEVDEYYDASDIKKALEGYWSEENDPEH